VSESGESKSLFLSAYDVYKLSLTYTHKKIERWGYRKGSTIKSIVCFSGKPGLNYQHLYGDPSPVPGDLILCSGLCGHSTHMQSTLTLKIK
jgi:hypothetical protein